MQTHTYFNPKKITAHLNHHNKLFKHLPTKIQSYPQFTEQLPIIDGDKINFMTKRLIKRGHIQSATFATSSGTTGEPKIFVNALWRDKKKQTYAKAFKDFISRNIIYKNDVVANLFTAGEFSTLYDGCNRLLETIGVNILPVGKLNVPKNQQHKFLKLMKMLNVNVLMGTPLAIIQCLKLSQAFEIKLSIEKILFTGEAFQSSQRQSVMSHWSSALIYGLYGQAETGFIGIQTPHCHSNHYHIFEDWYFVEFCNEEVIVTDLVNPIIPIFRYRVGDRGILHEQSCACGIKLPLMEIKCRLDHRFNFSGNLIDALEIQNKITQIFSKNIEIQVQLRSNEAGYDSLAIVLNEESLSVLHNQTQLEKMLNHYSELNEGIKRGVAKVTFLSREHLIQSGRQKQPLIMDLRN